MKKSKAFTLSEVLVTLGIVGTIAALTVPTIKKISDEHAFVAGAQKSYSTLMGAVKQAKLKYGAIKFWDSNSTTSGIANILKNEMSLGAMSANDYPSSDVKMLNGSSNTYTINTNSSFYTVDGAFWSVVHASSSCNANTPCFVVFTDVNGAKAPNTVGVDIFAFFSTTKEVLPYGAKPLGDTESCKSGNGLACTYQILRDKQISW